MKKLITLCLAGMMLAGQAFGAAPAYPSSHFGALTVDGAITGGSLSGTDASASTALGRTLAARAGDVINVKDAPYRAQCNGTADDTAGFQAALTAIAAAQFGGTLLIPDGDCKLSAQVAASIGQNQRIVLRSDGMHAARLHFTNSASAGFVITMQPIPGWLPAGPSVAAENLTFVADWTGTYGTALSVVQADPGTGTYVRNPMPSVSLKNITWMGGTGSSSFLTGAYLFGTNLTNVENPMFWGVAGDTTSTMLQYDTSVANRVVVDHSIINPRMHSGGTAIKIGGPTETVQALQGFDIWRPSFTGNAVGIDIESAAGGNAGGMSIMGGQINTTQVGVKAVYAGGIKFLGTDYIMSGPQMISITGNNGYAFIGNQFISPGGSAQTAIVLNNIVNGNNSATTISGNLFENFANSPISLTGTTDYVQMVGNNNRASAVLVSDTTGSAHNLTSGNQVGGVADPVVAPSATLGGLTVNGASALNGTLGVVGALTVNGSATFTNKLNVSASLSGVTTFPTTGLTAGWSYTGGQGEVDLMLGPQGGAGGLNAYQLTSTGTVANGGSPIWTLGSTGNMGVTGTLNVTGLTSMTAGASVSGGNFSITGSANGITLSGAAAGLGSTVAATGTDTSVNLNLSAKGTGQVAALALLTATKGIQITNSHFISFSGTLPTLSACGTSPSASTFITDTKGTVTEGATATGCTITFATAYAVAPDCAVSSPSGASFTGYSTSTTALTITNASASGNKYSYVCVQ